MSDLVELVVPGEPSPWKRARRNGKRYFKAEAVIDFERRVQTAWLVEGRPFLDNVPLVIHRALFVFERKPSHLKKDGTLRSTAPAIPSCDLDNLLKGVLDALNGHLYVDDVQVVRVRNLEKRYVEGDEEARSELAVEPDRVAPARLAQGGLPAYI